MFFSWFKENKQFKKRGGVSGQITPFLLVVLVILLIAAIATVNIGRVSLDKTSSANAADAGALAAASIYATALNNLAQANANMEDNFDTTYLGKYEVTYLESQEYLNEAIMYALVANAAAGAAAALVMRFSPCGDVWYQGASAAALLIVATIALQEAYKALIAFYYCAQVMKSITDAFHESQWKAFCNNVVAMDSAYESSHNAGFTYAFSNSGISSKLSDTQNDEFGLWMSSFTTESGSTDDWMLAQPAKDGIYSWQDKALQKHTVTAALDLPKVVSYELQHTTGSYSEISDLLDDAISESSLIAGVFNSTAVILGTQAAMLLVAFVFSLIVYVLKIACEKCVAWTCVICAVAAAFCLIYVGQELIVTVAVIAIASIVAIYGALISSSLKAKNDEAHDKWYPDGIYSIKNCQACKPCRNDVDGDLGSCTPCQAASNLLIVRIAEIIFPYWYTICKTTQQHPGTSSGIMATKYPTLTSSSKASFDGGDVGSFESTYDAKITETK